MNKRSPALLKTESDAQQSEGFNKYDQPLMFHSMIGQLPFTRAIQSYHVRPSSLKCSCFSAGLKLLRQRDRFLGQNICQYLHHESSQSRINELNQPHEDLYPRISSDDNHLSCRSFVSRYSALASGESNPEAETILYGRVSGLRGAGAKLFFVDIQQGGQQIQAVCNLKQLRTEQPDHLSFQSCYRRLRNGDVLRLEGVPYKTTSGELSILLRTLPRMVSPCLPPLPVGLQDRQTRARSRHVDYLVNPTSAEPIRTKSAIVQFLRNFLLEDGHIEVQTPILSAEAGGASARSFQTVATEFTSRKLALRIAPELWLKRLVIGGFERVFEIGQSFRNEGIDSTHNPEFTTCEFYRTYTNVDELMSLTENLLGGLSSHLHKLAESNGAGVKAPDLCFNGTFKRIDFVPSLESAMGRKLPDLRGVDAQKGLESLLKDLSIDMQGLNTTARMLDRLSAIFLEPQCHQPTFIINHPECLSPLSKSFHHPTTGQVVSARAELFVHSTEIINMYEEENSPIEQRRKFSEQLMIASDNSDAIMNKSYLEALEWGLPPTGGWGCGIERLCMMISGVSRISDVLTFGTLRHVTSVGMTK